MKVNFVVVDSGPIIKGAVLENFSKHAISVPGVIKEIRDVKTRERMRNLPPYFFSIKSPSDKAINHVINVSKITGDCKVLSKIDIEVLALAYEMQYLKTPKQVEEMFEKCELDSDIETDEISDIQNSNDNFFKVDDGCESIDSIDETDSEEEEEEDDNLESELNELEITGDHNNENEDNLNDDDTKEVISNTGLNEAGWITAENFDSMKANNFGMNSSSTANKEQVSIDQLDEIPLIGCLTTDYAMQNVLLKMNITILSLNGMVIKEPRIFVSYCRSCFKKFRRTDIFFCPHCGNENLGKVPAKIKENGEMELFLRDNFIPNLRHTKFSIPTPKGGKHADGNFYIYCADQKVPIEKKKKVKCTFDVTEEGNVPFAIHDVTSRSSVLGIHQQRNQNLKPSRPRGNRCARLKK